MPIHDIRVSFHSKYNITKVALQPSGKPLEVSKTPAGATVIVPRLDVHAMVVGELEPGR